MNPEATLNNRTEQDQRNQHQLIANPQFWSIVFIFALITMHHYDNLTSFSIFSRLDLPLGLTRHTIDRILYLVPVILSSFAFGSKGGKIALAAAVAAMLPRALFISPIAAALWETAIITLIGAIAPFGLNHYKKQEKRLEDTMEKLELTEQELSSSVQLSQEQEKQLHVINTVSKMLSQSFELERLMKTTINMVVDVMQVETVLIFSVDEKSRSMRLVAYEGISDESAKILDGMKPGTSLCGRVTKTGRPITADDICDNETFFTLPIKEDLQTRLSVPLVTHGKTMGTICVATQEQRQFAEPDVELLSALGNLIGVAMRNVNLYREREIAIGQLQLSERRYRRLFENAHDAIWLQDLTGNITAANQAAAELFGCTLRELIGADSHQFLRQEGYISSETVQRNILSGETNQLPYRQKIKKRDGTEAFAMLTTNLISINGKPDSFQFIGRDITREVRMQENQRFYLKQITSGFEEERQRISRDLHDSTAQNLIAMLRQLERFIDANTEMPEGNIAFFQSLVAQLKDTLQDIRQISRDLRPSVLDNLGLFSAVGWLIEQLWNEEQIRADLVIEGEEKRFSPEVEITLFRIIQEALRNVAKHAGATEAKVSIALRNGETRVTIADNGRGFELPTTLGDLSLRGKLGLDGMQTRAKLVGGSFDIRSSAGGGTVITVTIPE